MITKIWLQEYGPFREASFSLAPLTVLVGPNASGKTTAMEALYHAQKGSHSLRRRIGAEGEEPVLVLIDELEHSLHPKALRELVKCLRKMTETMNVQILATSHSPYLLDWLKPEEVRLTGFLDDDTATICELSDHPEFERWKNVMTPGEFWSTAGEDWIRELRR